LKVLHIITRLDSGGAATNTVASVDGLNARGFEATLVYGKTHDPDGSIRRDLEERQIASISIPKMVRDVAPLMDVRAFRKMRRLIDEGDYDLVHTHSSKAGALGRLAARASRLPIVHTPHGHIFYGYFGWLPTRLFAAVEQYLARFTERIVSLTEDETREALAHGIGRPGQYRTIPSGVPLQWYAQPLPGAAEEFRHTHGIPPSAPLVVSTGRLAPVKGFDILVRAFARSPACRSGAYLAVVGDGPERETLEQLARREGVAERVRFTGHARDVRPALRACNVFALASRNEGMGRSLVEALAGGCAVVATDAGGIPTFLTHRANGLLVPREDTGALADALERLLTETSLRDELARNAPGSLGPEFDQATMVERLADLYHDALGSS